jgi:class 3 adenylate cyclase/tetratricopeptide (TPR) repeat protein
MNAPHSSQPRHLVAVWFADVVGYSRLASANEDGALRLVGRFQTCVRGAVERYGGRVVKFVGDAALAEFSSTDAAARSALLLLEEFQEESDTQLRIGLHVGDLVPQDDGDVMGDGVNLAVRLQADAEPGEVLVSEDAWRQLRHREGYRFREAGRRHLKGQVEPVGVFVLLPGSIGAGEATAAASADPGGPGGRRLSWAGALSRATMRLPRSVERRASGGSSRTSSYMGGLKERLARGTRLRLLLLPLALIALFAPAAGLWTMWSSGQVRARDAATAEAERTGVTTIAVMPFLYQGTPDWADLGEGLVTLLSSSLDGAGELRSVDHFAVLSHALALDDSERLSPAHTREIADRLQADLLILGSVFASAEKIRISAFLYRVDGEPVAEWSGTVEGTEPMALVDELSRKILEGQLVSAEDRLSRIAAQTTSSSSALKAWLQGNREFRAARYDDAVATLKVAVREDPSFALAHYRLSTAAAWNFDFTEARRAARKALELSGNLTPRDMNLVRAWHSLLNGDWTEAERLYHLVLAEDGFDVEARSGLGEVQAHYNSLRGKPANEAEDAFNRVLQLAPNYGEARFHLMEFAARRGDKAAVDSLLIGGDPESPQMRSWQAARELSWGDPARADSIIRSLQEAPDRIVGVAGARAAVHFANLDAGESLARLLTRPGRSAPWQGAGHIMLAQGYLARGDWASARTELDASMEVDRGWALEMRALGALLPDAPVDNDELRQLRAELEVWDPRELNAETTFFFGTHWDVHAQLSQYLLALLSLRLDDLEAARRHSGAIRSTGRGDPSGSIGASLRLSVEAHRAARAGDSARALRLLEGDRLKAPLERVALSPFFAQALDRYLRAELLTTLGRPEEALRWYASLSDGADLMFWAAAHRRQSELLTRMGRAEEAPPHAERVRALRGGHEPRQSLLPQPANRSTSPP